MGCLPTRRWLTKRGSHEGMPAARGPLPQWFAEYLGGPRLPGCLLSAFCFCDNMTLIGLEKVQHIFIKGALLPWVCNKCSWQATSMSQLYNICVVRGVMPLLSVDLVATSKKERATWVVCFYD